MAKAKRNAAIEFEQFEKQLVDAGIENLQEVILGKREDGGYDSITIRLGNSIGLDPDEAEEFGDRIRECETSQEVCMVILDYDPAGRTAQEQWDLYHGTYGKHADHLAALFTSRTTDQAERLGKVRVVNRRR